MQQTNEETVIRTLYHRLLECWNQRSAFELASLFEEGGEVIGFDGSLHSGRANIDSDLRSIFDRHPTPAYVGKVKSIRLLNPDTALLRAVAGMVPRGQHDIDPEVNAVQTLVAVRREGKWWIASFQNTPAAFHGRPELGEQLTEELRQALDGGT
jgi:uncharacterized protein (TIGR02246 family)